MRWVFLIVFPIAALFAVYGAIELIGGQIADSRTAHGTVLSIDHVSAGKAASCSERYSFTVDGTNYRGDTSPHCTGKVGGTVTVHYNPSDPHESSLDGLGFSIFVDVMAIVLTTLLILASLVIWGYQRTLWRKGRAADASAGPAAPTS